MLQYILRRLLQAIPMLVGISFAAFVLMRLAPGGPMAIYAQNPSMSEADMRRIEHILGLDQPIHIQYLKWAAGMATGRGRIGPELAVQPGRALAFADDPGWPEVPRLLGDPAVDTDPPDWLLDGMVSVLTRWAQHWGQRPSVVVPMPSRSRPRLVHGIAERLATVGRLPLVDALATNGPAPSHALAPSRRAGLVETSLRLVPGTQLDGPVLLVDDTLRTGWTVTVAGALLRAAGAPVVLPLVVHRRP